MKRQQRWFLVSVVAAGLVAGAYGAAADDAANPPPPKGWEGSAAAGLTVTSGNSDTILGTLSLAGKREWPTDVWGLGSSVAYGQDHGNVNNEKADGFVDYQHLFNERLYGGAHLSAIHDAIAAVEYRVSVGPNLGYYFIKTPLTKLSGEIGPAYVFERVRQVPKDTTEKPERDPNDYMTLRLAERFDRQLTPNAKLWQTVEILPQVDKWDNYKVRFELGTEAAISKSVALRLVLQDNYDHRPAAGRKTNDITFIGSVAYKF